MKTANGERNHVVDIAVNPDQRINPMDLAELRKSIAALVPQLNPQELLIMNSLLYPGEQEDGEPFAPEEIRALKNKLARALAGFRDLIDDDVPQGGSLLAYERIFLPSWNRWMQALFPTFYTDQWATRLYRVFGAPLAEESTLYSALPLLLLAPVHTCMSWDTILLLVIDFLVFFAVRIQLVRAHPDSQKKDAWAIALFALLWTPLALGVLPSYASGAFTVWLGNVGFHTAVNARRAIESPLGHGPRKQGLDRFQESARELLMSS